MDGADGALLSGSDPVGSSYSLLDSDVQAVMQFLWLLSVVELVQLAVLVIVAGMLLGYLVTRKWGD